MKFDGELTRFDIFKNPIENHALSSANTENFVLQVPPDERKKKSKLIGGRNLMIEKNFKERKVHKIKSIREER